MLGTQHAEITLANREGIQLRRIGGDRKLLRMTERRRMLNGTDFSETSAGTCGVGLCLAVGHPVVVLGPEHYHSMYRDLVCYAAPVEGVDGTIVGCLNVTTPLETYDAVTLEALDLAARGITGEPALRARDTEGEVVTLGEAERRALVRAVTATHGNVPQAAGLLGVPTSTLYRKLKAHSIVASTYR